MPTAVLVQDEFCAAYIFRKCHKLGIRIPDEMSLAAITDNTPDLHSVPLTASDALTQNINLANMATKMLVKLINGEDVAEREINLKCNINCNRSRGRVAEVRHNASLVS